jgi:glycosyltransferase involved in cell wall biosynthesis
MVRYLPSKVYNVFSRRVFVPPADIMTATKPDVAIFGNYVRPPLLFGAKSISFVYDISYDTHRDKADKKNSNLMMKRVPITLRQSDVIVTISENSKCEICERYGTEADKIHIINPALDHDEYYPRSDEEQRLVAERYNIAKPYILYVGTIEPRKNIVGLLDAYAQLPKDLRGKYSLVLAGGKGWKNEEIYRRIKELSHLDIILTGYVPDDDLPALHTGASLFVFPTFYEGWGMPPLEAMACGTPVITSNNSSLPEVVGDAGIMVDAKDTTGLTGQMARVLTDKKLSAGLIEKGIKQAAKFSWDKSARQLSEIIENLAK